MFANNTAMVMFVNKFKPTFKEMPLVQDAFY